jgi:hypothetical protein
MQPLVTGLMAKQPAERYNTGASFVEALHKLVSEAPEGVNLHQSTARKGTGNRISGSSATQQRTRVNLSQSASGRPAWLLPAAGGGVLALAVAAWLVFNPGASSLDPANNTNPDMPPTRTSVPTNVQPDVATSANGEPLAVQFGNANAGDPVAALSAQEVEDLLSRADAYLAKGTTPEEAGRFLTFPKDDSALGLYRRVLESDPENARAKEGVAAVTGYYKDKIYQLCNNGKWTACGTIARKMLEEIDPSDSYLLQLNDVALAGERGESPQVPSPD